MAWADFGQSDELFGLVASQASSSRMDARSKTMSSVAKITLDGMAMHGSGLSAVKAISRTAAGNDHLARLTAASSTAVSTVPGQRDKPGQASRNKGCIECRRAAR